MTDISMLLKEAKPLYMKRKKRRAVIKNAAVGLTMCSLLLGLGVQNFSSTNSLDQLNDLYVALYDDEVFETKYQLFAQDFVFLLLHMVDYLKYKLLLIPWAYQIVEECFSYQLEL